ncbi:MAG: hypothetical protein WEB53_04745 [Akkermansiaceae bacterium]
MFPRFFLLSCGVLGGFAVAEEAPQHRLRLLAVGSPPPFIQEIRDGARYEVPPAEGTVPPRVLIAPDLSGSAETAEDAKTPLRLRLGQPSIPVSFTFPESGRLRIEPETGGKWLELPLHECGASLALIWRGGSDWSKPQAIVVPDDMQARAEGKVHFANLTSSPMAVVVGTAKVRLNPGKIYQRRMTPGEGALPLEISYVSPAGTLKSCHSSSLELTRGCFHRIIIYAADGKSPRMPVKVLQLEEAG